jgi:hypothetical protein
VSDDTLGDRLERLFPTLTNDTFLNNQGIGNEIGFHIFPYDAKEEERVSDYVTRLKQKLLTQASLPVLEFNLYHLILDILKESDLLEKSFELEAQKGSEALQNAFKKIIRPEILIERVEAGLTNPHKLVFITGVGAAYPVVRSHTVLNNLHSVVDKVPLVMFYPGSYDGLGLRLFDALKDDNYYRAFPLLLAAR